MPRFGTKALLVVFAVVALWLSTFAGGAASDAIRKSILLLVNVGAAFAAIYFRGRWRAFWAAFTVVLLLLDAPPALHKWLPANIPQVYWHDSLSQSWARELSNDSERQSNLGTAIFYTIRTTWNIGLATLGGVIAAYIYDQSRKQS